MVSPRQGAPFTRSVTPVIPGAPLVSLRAVRKDYQGLRPLRVAHLELREAQTVALLGFDAAAAEVLVNLITGATLPDEGEVDAFGSPTRDITNSADWFTLLEAFGIANAVQTLAEEVGIPAADLGRPVARIDTTMRVRVRLGKALAMHPRVLLAEHPNASLPPSAAAGLAADLAAMAARRSVAMLVMTADSAFAEAACETVLSLRPATGELVGASRWSIRGWFPPRR
jgi:ABC-type branched-subunit amino acid transport system ATPase component